ncbi:hypothetical protein F3Y22_tig00112411pilonHSYRG00033 [Hibiscus syriacus]|uniref:Beta-galactosidase n=1 Tax=Hibiscus syriacus TaxID=106335 RepID=A0A6A2Y841_HIBSY|nr:hypothetical protein F3Y22_tig00112411pilonHSYRG00033 [Hibiscus syriacus]
MHTQRGRSPNKKIPRRLFNERTRKKPKKPLEKIWENAHLEMRMRFEGEEGGVSKPFLGGREGDRSSSWLVIDVLLFHAKEAPNNYNGEARHILSTFFLSTLLVAYCAADAGSTEAEEEEENKAEVRRLSMEASTRSRHMYSGTDEPVQGQFNFEGQYDLVKFIKLIHQNNSMQSLGWDPLSRLNGTTGGPIVLAQIENEYNTIQLAYREKGESYIKWAAKLALGLDVDVPWIMCKQMDAPDPIINTCNGRHCGDTFPGPKIRTSPHCGPRTGLHSSEYSGIHHPKDQLKIWHTRLLASSLKNGSMVNYMYYGGTNFGRTSSSFTSTRYYDEAPLDDMWGHLKDVHKALNLCKRALLWGVPTVEKLSAHLEAIVWQQPGAQACAAFLANNNTQQTQTMNFKGQQYRLPPRSISILPIAGPWCSTLTREVPPTETAMQSPGPMEHWILSKDNRLLASEGHGVHAFVNGEYIGTDHGSKVEKNFVFQKPAPFKEGTNHVALLSSLELAEKRKKIYTEEGSKTVTWTKPDQGGAITWYKGHFDAPEGNNPVAITMNVSCPNSIRHHRGCSRTKAASSDLVNDLKPKAELKCLDQKVISRVEFASFGDPFGSCAAFVQGNCTAPATKQVVEKLCMGKPHANPVEAAEFGDMTGACPPNTPKILAVQLFVDQPMGSFLRELGVVEASEPGCYLGLPLVVGKGKRAAFNFIKDRTEKRIQGWTKRLLSFGGREVFIKSVVQALPAYAMSCYLIPDGVLEDIKSQARSFWWSGKQNTRGWAMVTWDRICKAKKFGGMGFRDLHMFNVALLGNQIWRFIHDENSLAFKVIKAKYFPNTSFFEARLGSNFSYAWASLMKAKEDLKDGFFWRVGIDSGIRMFEENWGDDCAIEWGERYVDNAASPVRVAEFMVPGCARWDEDKVVGVLRTADADKVLKTLIAPVREDRLLWKHHGSGFYSAKSGYNWLMIRSSPTLVVDGIWNRIARARVLPKIRIFGWRICHDAIPVGAKLVQASIGNGVCPLCLLELETVLHAIKDCPKVRSVLEISGLSQGIVEWIGSSPLSWLTFAHSKLVNEGFDLFLTLLWNIWNRRNDLVHNGELQSDWNVVVCSSNLVEEFRKVKKVDVIDRDEVRFSRFRRWIKPGQEEIKVNVDGAFCKENRKASIGVVARDSQGMVIAGLAKMINPPSSAESAEVAAFTEGIKLAIENGWNRVIIEGDAISIVNRLANKRTGKIQDFSTIGLLLNEARLLLSRAPTFKVHYVSREANRVAHTLAHWALSNTNPIWFYFDEPECIKQVVIDDAIGI